MNRKRAVGFMVAALVFGVGVSRADEPAASSKARGAGRGRPVVVVPPVLVQGKVQRPEAMFILPRPTVKYEWPELTRDLLPNVDRDARSLPAK
jgi:hypothetical protein